MSGQIFLGRTSTTKQNSNPQPLDIESSILPLSLRAPQYRICSVHDFSRNDTRGKGQIHSDLETVCEAPGPKVYPHTKFGIPTLYNIGDMLRTLFF